VAGRFASRACRSGALRRSEPLWRRPMRYSALPSVSRRTEIGVSGCETTSRASMTHASSLRIASGKAVLSINPASVSICSLISLPPDRTSTETNGLAPLLAPVSCVMKAWTGCSEVRSSGALKPTPPPLGQPQRRPIPPPRFVCPEPFARPFSSSTGECCPTQGPTNSASFRVRHASSESHP
jgi:hypothetical protein